MYLIQKLKDLKLNTEIKQRINLIIKMADKFVRIHRVSITEVFAQNEANLINWGNTEISLLFCLYKYGQVVG